MDVSTELFVLVLFVAAFPVFIFLFKLTPLPGAIYFILAYTCLLLSNIFTVIESSFYFDLFNILEHVFIALCSILFFIFIWKLTNRRKDIFSNSAE